MRPANHSANRPCFPEKHHAGMCPCGTWNLPATAEYNRNEKFFSGDQMDSWKKAAVVGSIGAAAIFFMKKRYPAGVLATGLGLAVLASEYPDKFEKVRRALPEYFDRGMRVMEMAGRAGRRITEAAGQRAAEAWEEIGG